MEREAGLLRCSKLNCYTEFNRMVQAIARHREGGGLFAMPGVHSMNGTSAEYYFYTTLSMMMRQVVSNSNPNSQKRELEQIYEWFCINKPLISDRTKPRSRKPMLSLRSSRPSFLEAERPQTAPASLYQPQRRATEQRPHTTTAAVREPQQSFTSSYMSRSLGGSLDIVGRPFDQLVSLGSPAKRKSSAGRGEISTTASSGRGTPSGRQRTPRPLAVVSIPSPSSLEAQLQRPSLVNFGMVFVLAPSMAAQLTLNREMRRKQEVMLRSMSAPPNAPHDLATVSRRLTNTPTEERASPEVAEPSNKDTRLQCSTDTVPHQQRDAATHTHLDIHSESGQKEFAENPKETAPSSTSEVIPPVVRLSRSAGPTTSNTEVPDVSASLNPTQSPLAQDKVFITSSLSEASSKQISVTATESTDPKLVQLQPQKQFTSNSSTDPERRASDTDKPRGDGHTEGGPRSRKDMESVVGESGAAGQTTVKITTAADETQLHQKRPTTTTHKRRVSTPLSVVSIAFPFPEEPTRPKTSIGITGNGTRWRRPAMAAAGFNKTRYRTKSK